MSLFGEVVGGRVQGREGVLVPVVEVRHLPILSRGGGGGGPGLEVEVRGVEVEHSMVQPARVVVEGLVGTRVKVSLLEVEGEGAGGRVCTKVWGVWRGCVGRPGTLPPLLYSPPLPCAGV